MTTPQQRTLPMFSPAEQARAKVRRRVRPTSRAQYADARDRFTGRKADVLRWLAAYYNRHQVCPTSGELANTEYPRALEWTAFLLYVRRGLSDLQTAGVVEAVPGGDRPCTVTQSKCCTWRVRPR